MANKQTTRYPLLSIIGEAYWAKVYEPDENKKFTIDVNLDAKAVAIFKQYGMDVKNKAAKGDTRGDFGTFWTYAFSQDGTPNKLTIVDAAMKPFSELIGNGSLVKIEFQPKYWEYGNKEGVRPSLLALQVLKHVPYIKSTLKAEPEYVEASDESSKFAAQG